MEILKLDIPDRLSLFKLPNTSNSKGFYFGDWKEQFWEGGLKIFESNDKLTIKFYKDGKMYTQLVVPDNYEEAIVKCEDSVRGFALRLNNPNGGFAWIGKQQNSIINVLKSFRDRNSAFDFRSRIIDFCERKTEETTQTKYDFNNVEDLSIKKGEKISFSLGGAAKTTTSNNNSSNQQPGNYKFEMPNQGNNNFQSSSNSQTGNNNWDNWNFGSSNTNNNNNNNNNNNQQKDFFGDFSDFSNFGNNKQNQQPQQQQQQQWDFGGNQNSNQWGFGNNSQPQNNFSNNNQQNQQNNTGNKPQSNVIDLLDL